MSSEPTVFVVDDDQAVLESLSFLLASRGIPCECFASATEFLAAFDESRSGCLLIDVRMPGMDGIELHRRLTSCNIYIPTIVMTGNADVQLCVEAMKRGVLDFVEKPCHPEKLLEIIARALASMAS